jgi:hypothetical protein
MSLGTSVYGCWPIYVQIIFNLFFNKITIHYAFYEIIISRHRRSGSGEKSIIFLSSSLLRSRSHFCRERGEKRTRRKRLEREWKWTNFGRRRLFIGKLGPNAARTKPGHKVVRYHVNFLILLNKLDNLNWHLNSRQNSFMRISFIIKIYDNCTGYWKI